MHNQNKMSISTVSGQIIDKSSNIIVTFTCMLVGVTKLTHVLDSEIIDEEMETITIIITNPFTCKVNTWPQVFKSEGTVEDKEGKMGKFHRYSAVTSIYM